MLKKVKPGKIAIVIFLTILIWVWTDLDLDEELSGLKGSISAAYNEDLLVSFGGRPNVVITNIKFRGPAKKISEKSRDLDDGNLDLDFMLNPEREGITTAGSLTLKVMDFLNRSDKIKEFGGLTVEECEPEIIDVNVVRLVKKQLDIECRDENGLLLNVVSIDPEKIEMHVPEDSRLKAQVQMTNSNINQARISEAVVLPYVELAGQKRRAAAAVKVKMSPKDSSLSEYRINDAKLIFGLSKNLLGHFYVDVDNSTYNNLVSFSIIATPEAKQVYENQPYQITLIILDGDEKKGPEVLQRRDVVYNFPTEYVSRNEIRLKNEPGEAEFRVKPLKLADTEQIKN
ncbi:MAG: hypothetical protein JW837_01855 [Sedimentisphaerales bacterium]|nr:hypothetical protein [Sedimentisphaerales bacterium]